MGITRAVLSTSASVGIRAAARGMTWGVSLVEPVVEPVSRRVLDPLLDLLVPAVVETVLAHVDLTETVRRHVDLDQLVASVDLDGAVATVDLDRVVGRLDLIGLANTIIAGVDLPEIIRESTGSMASETVRGFRMQGISGDEALSRAVERLHLRRPHPAVAASAPAQAPAETPASSAASSAARLPTQPSGLTSFRPPVAPVPATPPS